MDGKMLLASSLRPEADVGGAASVLMAARSFCPETFLTKKA